MNIKLFIQKSVYYFSDLVYDFIRVVYLEENMEVYDETEPLNPDFPLRMNKMWLRKSKYGLSHFHKHRYFEVTCIMNGCGFISVNGERYDVMPGDVVIFNTDEVHGWEIVEDLRIFVMVFSSELIFNNFSLFDSEYLRFFSERGSHFVNKIPAGEIYAKRIYGAMEDIYNEWIHDEVGRQLMMKAFVLRILTMLTRHYKNNAKNQAVLWDRNEKMNRLQASLSFINENYDTKIKLEEAAAKAYMSPNYFSGFFKKVTGENFSQYVMRVRIHKAQELLEDKNNCYNVLEISQMCGFNNASNFYRVYKKITGKTPTENRKTTAKS